MQMGYGMGMYYGMGIIWLIFWIIIIIGLALLIKYLLEHDGIIKSDTALEILRKRYASGEITKEEFEDKKKDLL